MTSAGAAYARRQDAMERQVVTPEGVDLRLEIGSAGARLAALLIDFFLQSLVILGFVIIFGFAGLNSDGAARDVAGVGIMLGIFLLTNFWFIGFELGPRAATPGKRLLGLRVVARDGGQLSVASVVARNFVRQLEILLPAQFIMNGMGDALGAATALLGLVWTLGLGCFLLFNKDRMRLGDLIAGTWVVQAKRRRIAREINENVLEEPADGPVFTNAELAVYGVFELQELERVIRTGDLPRKILVADTIRAKLGRPLAEDDMLFLVSFYRQLKAKQERDLLFGKRRADKNSELQ